MLSDLKVKVGPQFYRYHDGAISFIPELLRSYQATKVLVVHGTVSWEKARKFMPFLKDNEFDYFYHQYTGHCSYYGTELIEEKVRNNDIDFIIGVGGGSLTDLVGYAASRLNIPFGVVPTLASNCAPWTPLSVMYKENGEGEGKTEHFYRQAAFFITDPNLVIDAPVNLFIAGLTDTIAKWYEAQAILEQKHLSEENFLQLAYYVAKLSKTKIEKQAFSAIEAIKNQEMNEDFFQLSEIIFGIAGLVGGLGDRYARNAAAHAMHDALAKYVPESKKFLHGEKVAYGILYQLAIEEKWDVIDSLMPFYQRIDAPFSLTRMGLYPLDNQTIDNMVKFIDSLPKVHLIPVEINYTNLKEAILKLEEYMKDYQEQKEEV
ncbi:iron-containing alcohol dehydrogenase family protein [Dolosicoccus paucivorans]|uniref:iron-containing alcohol dehydrogenase family protein n=1 Tax=Dolosicoccus paucivorans TaxID=84521 RepID=UPI0008884698|nr:iron-containing alcohol dehydrogenase family protein [Dolosicoccus paucivorans]PMB85077.1 oxidoreductase [Dolosicoccus paucivorans]SDI68305.1 uncharacterized oxidoreductase [Dolosicoccus paucivorans]